MHNLHLAVVKADDHRNAIDDVASSIASWGNDNNWYSVFGALYLKDNSLVITNRKVFAVEYVEQKLNAIQSIETTINKWIGNVPYCDIAKQFKADESRLSSLDYYCLERYASHMHEVCAFKNKRYTVHGMQGFFEYQYDQCGITYLDAHHHWDKNYVVFIDMHS